jgi:hypothetical protein
MFLSVFFLTISLSFLSSYLFPSFLFFF